MGNTEGSGEKQTAAGAGGTRQPCWGGQEGHGSLGNLEGALGEAGKGRVSRKRGAWPHLPLSRYLCIPKYPETPLQSVKAPQLGRQEKR